MSADEALPNPPSFDEFIMWLGRELDDEIEPGVGPSDELIALGWDSLRIAEACVICFGETRSEPIPESVRTLDELFQIHLNEVTWASP